MHRSYLNEGPGLGMASNERLEFLGDSVLGFIVASHLYEQFPEAEEGRLTEMKVSLIREAALAEAARAVGLGEALYMGRGEERGGGRNRPRILESAFEAVLGAIYLDQGIEAAREVTLRLLAPQLARLERGIGQKDPKSALQEHTQRERQITPSYHTIEATGPDHAKVFTVEVRLGDEVLSRGKGHSKREAEEMAARRALQALLSIEQPPATAAD